MIEGRVIPDWKKFISCGENKQSLIRFLGDYIVKHINQNSSLQEGQSLYLPGLFSNPETVKMLNQNGMLDCSCLASTQEEAETFNRLEPMYHLSDSNIIVSRQWHNAQTQQGRSCTSTGTGRFYNTNTGIALVQSINAKRFRTFGEMALDFVKNQISCVQFASVVVDIFDKYDIQNSIRTFLVLRGLDRF